VSRTRRIRVMTIVGTRPELIKLSRILAELDRQTDHVMVHSGQNYDYELNEIFYSDLGIRRPDHFLAAARDSVAASIAAIIETADRVMAQEKPEALLLYGDTNTCLAVIAAKRRRIPVFHLEAGNRCFDQRVPEELNRKLVDHLSDINMPQTEHARRYLLAEGLRPETVIKVGSPMREVLAEILPRVDASTILDELDIAPGEFFLASAHREENVDDPKTLANLVEGLWALNDEYGLPVIVSTHPRTRQRLVAAGLLQDDLKLRWLPPFGYVDYLRLQMSARCTLSDSGTLTEEAAIVGFPAVMLREAHERPEGQDVGVAPFVPMRVERMLQAVAMVLSQSDASWAPDAVADYASMSISHTVTRLILSYTGYVNRTVWGRGEG
jgi:UDP-N-acetylglucosamine 2-epimerase